MNMWRPVLPRQLEPDAKADVARIDAIWTDCRARFGAGGPFLYGAFGAADAIYAPVVSRFHTYAVGVSAVARDYMCVRSWRNRPGTNGATPRCASPGFCRTTKSIGRRSSASRSRAGRKLGLQLGQERPLVFDEL